MGKFTRRGAVAGVAAVATALSMMATPALANTTGDPIDIDGAPDVATSSEPDIYRFAAADRVGTAVQAALRTDADHWGDTVIIANTEVFADALAATPLADVLDAPVLLNNPGNSLSGQVASFLEQRPQFTNAIVLGGTDVFGAGMVDGLVGTGSIDNVDRIAGTNRYQTAVELAIAAVVEDAGRNSEIDLDQANIFMADGTNFPDALAAGAAAAEHNGVVLLTRGSQGLDSVTYGAINLTNAFQQAYQVPRWNEFADNISVITVGGPAAAGTAAGWLSDPVEADLDIIGADRYDTAVKLAERFFDFDDIYNDDNGRLPGYITFASGEKFADGVVAGAYAANADGPLLLTRQNSLSQVNKPYLEGLRLQISKVFVFGGPDSIAPVVSQQIADLNWRY